MNEKYQKNHMEVNEKILFLFGDDRIEKRERESVFVFLILILFIYLKSKEEENKFLFFKNTKSKEQRSSASDSLRQLSSWWCSSR
jgi:hypothetical protein